MRAAGGAVARAAAVKVNGGGAARSAILFGCLVGREIGARELQLARAAHRGRRGRPARVRAFLDDAALVDDEDAVGGAARSPADGR